MTDREAETRARIRAWFEEWAREIEQSTAIAVRVGGGRDSEILRALTLYRGDPEAAITMYVALVGHAVSEGFLVPK